MEWCWLFSNVCNRRSSSITYTHTQTHTHTHTYSTHIHHTHSPHTLTHSLTLKKQTHFSISLLQFCCNEEWAPWVCPWEGAAVQHAGGRDSAHVHVQTRYVCVCVCMCVWMVRGCHNEGKGAVLCTTLLYFLSLFLCCLIKNAMKGTKSVRSFWSFWLGTSYSQLYWGEPWCGLVWLGYLSFQWSNLCSVAVVYPLWYKE